MPRDADFIIRSLLSACMLLCAVNCGAHGQQGDARSAAGPSATAEEPGTSAGLEQLQKRLAELKAELAREKDALSALNKRNEIEIEQRLALRRESADKLLGAQIESVRNADRLGKLRDQAERSVSEAKVLTDIASSIPRAVRDAIEQLRLHLREVPGSEADVERLRAAADRVTWSPDSASSVDSGSHDLFNLIDGIHESATRATVRAATIFTADGQRTQVKLLSLGHVRFAYQTTQGRVGLALSSPAETSGYRWTENLTAPQQDSIRAAVAAVEENRAGLFTLPVDPVGRLQPEALKPPPSLWERFHQGGLVMYPLAVLACVALLLIAERFLAFYVGNRGAERRAAEVLSACRAGEFQRAREACDRQRGAVGRVLAACLERRELGQRAMEDSIQEQLLHEMPRLQRFMGGICTLAAVAPLLGLLGTVTGIINTFGVIRAFGNANPSLMAGGISEALLTTAAGLIIAVPILILHGLLRGRADRIVADAERFAANLLTTLVHGAPVERQTQGELRESSKRAKSSNGVGQPRAEANKEGEEVAVD